MGLAARPSDARLSTKQVLAKISGYDIFKAYCAPFKELGEEFCSELRDDPNPSCKIQHFNDDYFYKDFSTGETYGCFKYLQAKYNTDLMSVLKMIDRDFGLGLDGLSSGSGNPRNFTVYKDPPKPKSGQKKLKVFTRPWRKADGKIWFDRWGIHLKTLKFFDVVPVRLYTVRNVPYHVGSTYAYAYCLFDRHKIYKPLEADKDKKWISDTKGHHIQGWKQLPETGDLVIITSSLKDCMVLYEMGYSACAPHSESEVLKEGMIDNLSKRFKRLAILYDNDWTKPDTNPGQAGAMKNVNKYPILNNIVIPAQYKSSDPAELVENHGFAKAREIINVLIQNL